jgi:hypothetical protein
VSFRLTAGTLCSANQERQRADDRAPHTWLRGQGAKVALAAIKGDRTLAELAEQFDVQAYLRAYGSVSKARPSRGRYLDFYNGCRPHSTLDRIKLTSPRCPSAWQPNHGSRFTYPCGKTVQTTGGHLIEPAAAFELPLIMQPWREPATPIARRYRS